MRLGKWVMGVLAAAAMGVGSMAQANTITVHDLGHVGGVYSYSVELDAAANVFSNDGFVIYDFPGLTNWALAGGLNANASGGQFVLTQQLSGNSLNASGGVDLSGATAAFINSIPFDDPSIPNLIFSYVGPPVPFIGATIATLTLTTNIVPGSTKSVYASVDHQADGSNSFSDNPITVPSEAVPMPASSLGGGALLGLLGLSRFMKSRRQDALA